ncbi:MAG TPA: D-alanyl-D-alanine carboxypeptidase, partial [Thermoanaerobaculia bacterium]|nr:D-alanyl-D-alanine carboxypeptidase [Thermoanaerobaculia bacterium]
MRMMQLRKRLFFLSLGLSLGLLGAAPALPQTPQTPLNQAVQAEVAHAQKTSREVGVNIVQLDTGEAVFSYNPQQPRVIASNSKLFTTSTALDTLGPGFVFETRFLMRGTVADGVLHGDIGVVGAGDPQISGREYEGDPFGAFRPWAAALRERGVRRIVGDLYLAHGLFEATEIHPDWPRDQLAEWYEAPVAALSFSDNCILVRVSPGKPGQPAVVETVPPVSVFRVDNSTSTRAARRGTKLFVGRTGDLLTV